MNNKTILFAAGAVLLAASAFTFASVNKSNDPMDDLFEANVEALARNEIIQRYECYDRYKLYVSVGSLETVRTCDICWYQSVYRPRTKSVCPL